MLSGPSIRIVFWASCRANLRWSTDKLLIKATRFFEHGIQGKLAVFAVLDRFNGVDVFPFTPSDVGNGAEDETRHQKLNPG